MRWARGEVRGREPHPAPVQIARLAALGCPAVRRGEVLAHSLMHVDSRQSSAVARLADGATRSEGAL